IKAASAACVASRPFGICLDQDCILITINMRTDYFQEMTAFLPLGPQAILAPGKKRYAALTLGFFPGLLVHITQHEHLQGPGVLYDSWHKASVFSKIQHSIAYLL